MNDDQVPKDSTPPPAPPPSAEPPVAPPVQPPYAPPPADPGYATPPPSGMGAWINAGWGIATGNLGMSILLMLIAVLPILVQTGIVYGLSFGSLRDLAAGGMAPGPDIVRGLQMKMMGTNLGLSLPFTLVGMLLWTGIIACFWEGVQTGRITLANIGLGFQMPGAAIVLGLILWGLNTIVSITAMFCIGVLLSFPALSLATLAVYDLVVRRPSGADAFFSGWSLLTASFWELAIMGLVCCAIYALGCLACGIGVFVAGPVIVCAYGVAYRELATRAGIVTGY